MYNASSKTQVLIDFPITFRDAYYACFGTVSGKTSIAINRITSSQMRIDKDANVGSAVTWLAAGV